MRRERACFWTSCFSASVSPTRRLRQRTGCSCPQSKAPCVGACSVPCGAAAGVGACALAALLVFARACACALAVLKPSTSSAAAATPERHSSRKGGEEASARNARKGSLAVRSLAPTRGGQQVQSHASKREAGSDTLSGALARVRRTRHARTRTHTKSHTHTPRTHTPRKRGCETDATRAHAHR